MDAVNGPSNPWGPDRPVPLQTAYRYEVRAQCWVAEAAWNRLNAMLAGPKPTVKSGTYRGQDARLAGVAEAVGFSYGLLEAVQSLLVAAGIIAELTLSYPDEGPRPRGAPRTEITEGFAELEGFGFNELPKTLARDGSVHLRGNIGRWHAQFGPDYRRLIATWTHGPDSPGPEPYRYLDTKTLRVRVNGEWCDLQQLFSEIREIALRIPIKVLMSDDSAE